LTRCVIFAPLHHSSSPLSLSITLPLSSLSFQCAHLSSLSLSPSLFLSSLSPSLFLSSSFALSPCHAPPRLLAPPPLVAPPPPSPSLSLSPPLFLQPGSSL